MAKFEEKTNLKILFPRDFSSEKDEETNKEKIKATRKDLQISRRLFHMANGFFFATAYALTLSHQQVVYLLGTIACSLYLLDHVRISYPELAKKFESSTKYLLRAEEQIKESAAIPYAIAILLTILSFPKAIAIASIYTLAFADPLSAIIGIKFGKHHIVKEKSVEGSIAFFICTFLAIGLSFNLLGITGFSVWIIAFLVGVIVTFFEMIPLRLDDNLTIPLFTAVILWLISSFFGLVI